VAFISPACLPPQRGGAINRHIIVQGPSVTRAKTALACISSFAAKATPPVFVSRDRSSEASPIGRSSHAGVAARISLALCGGLALLAINLAFPSAASAATTRALQGTFNGSGEAPEPLNEPASITVDHSSSANQGDVYVVDEAAKGHPVIDRFSAAGKYLSQITGSETTQGSFGGVIQLTVDPSSGDLYVEDRANEVYDKFDTSGKLVTAFGKSGQISAAELPEFQPGSPFQTGGGLTVDPETGNLYIGDIRNLVVVILDPTGKYIRTFNPGTYPAYLAFDSHGNLFVSSFGQILAFNAATETLNTSLFESGILSGGGQGLAVDPETDSVYSCQTGGSRSKDMGVEFDKTGKLLTSFGIGLTTRFSGNPIALDTSGSHVYLSDIEHSNVAIFGPISTVPNATTEPANKVTPTSATFNGIVNPAGTNAFYQFEYGTEEEVYNQKAPASPASVGNDNTNHRESVTVTGLQPYTEYHFRIVGITECDPGIQCPNSGEDFAFRTPGTPTVSAEASTNLEPTTATLHAAINPEGTATHYHFQYVDKEAFDHNDEGFSSPSTKETSSVALPGTGFNAESVQVAISGLTPGTVYHFRAVAESHCNELDLSEMCTGRGPDETLETLPPVSVRELTTQTVGPELVKLKAQLNPNGSTMTYTFRYGKDTSYTDGTSHGELAVGNEFAEVTATFAGLEPNTTYHYQLTAENEDGKVESADQIFTTEHSTAELRAVEHCPNTNLREENNSLSLPDCRAYEKASPNYKAGGEARPYFQVSPSGERVLYFSEGAFDNTIQNQIFSFYEAHRTATGWASQAVFTKQAPPGEQVLASATFSPELDHWLYFTTPGHNSEEADFETKVASLSMGFADGLYNASVATVHLEEGPSRTGFQFLYANDTEVSGDLSHAFILTPSRDLPLTEDPRPDDFGEGYFPQNTRLYEISGADGPKPVMRVAAEVPLGLLAPGGSNDTGCTINAAIGDEFRSTVSENGTTLFYTGPIEKEAAKNCGEGTPNPIALFARVDSGAETIQLNVPLPAQCSAPAPCATATPTTPAYWGASEDGSRVWFTTSQPLINSDKDSTEDLYMAKLESGKVVELVQASAGEATPTHPNPGEGAEVNFVHKGGSYPGVVKVSKDGTHAAFVSPSVLTTEPNSSGYPTVVHDSAVEGADNLYVYDSETGKTKFVAELCSGPDESGFVHDPACPPSEEEGGNERNDSYLLAMQRGRPGPVEFTPNGDYLLFTSNSRLTPDKTSNVRAVFRYDFQSGQLIRVSFGRDGNDGNGNDNAYPASAIEGDPSIGNAAAEDGQRSISADGSTVVFRTAAPLVSQDTNAGEHPICEETSPRGCDVYEWEEQGHGTCTEAGGCISLITDGVSPHGADSAVISSSGTDIQFASTDSLIPEDTDGVNDIYDARAGGGFHASHPPSPCGSPEACRPSPGAGPNPPITGSESFVGPGNSATQLECARGRHRVDRHGKVVCAPNSKPPGHHRRGRHKRAHRRGGK